MLSLRDIARDERGFTLPEMLVAVIVGIAVVLATLSVLDMAIKTQASTASRLEGTQAGRPVMAYVSRIIRSQTCLYDGNPSIVSASATSLRLHSAVGPERITEGYQEIKDRVLTFDATAKTLTEDVYTASGTMPNLTFTSLASSTRIGNNLRLIDTTPFFSYYAYTATAPYQPTVALTAPLSAADRARVVRIDVNFLVRAREGDSSKDVRFTESLYTRTADPDAPSGGTNCV